MTARATVLLLPGHMCDERMWAGLDLATAGARIAAPVLQGATIDEMADLCLKAGSGPLLPVGFSMGGIVALAIAARAPERLVGLGLLDTNPFADAPERAAQRPRQQEKARADGLSELVAEELKPNYLARINRGNARLRAGIQAMAEDLGPEVFVSQSEALRIRPSYNHVLETLDFPVFVACGAEDRLCTPALHADFASRIENAQLHVVEGAGHMLPMEQPHILSKLLNPWLASVLAREETKA
ncbi:alpha/beta fold hydrolase [Erythrobacter sp.]|jgi:pimeloyl-ACP methyl ester carboxylesterase|uniref:alpha/beta fold hydrolase n=1 Tax=Erythrobacter sp. TaxID=1042 RepID=UPI002EA865E7|nr:alpha/beta hydrolase [Erythrobacter sp.]